MIFKILIEYIVVNRFEFLKNSFRNKKKNLSRNNRGYVEL